MNLSRVSGWLLVSAVLLSCSLVESPPPDEPQPLSPRRAYYPRVLRLAHQPDGRDRLLASFDTDGNQAIIHESLDDGRTWQPVSNPRDTTDTKHCCSGFWEVPQPLGTVTTGVPAGTLFWSPSMGCSRDPRCTSAITIHRSTDGGRTWQPHSTLVTGTIGLWESEFIIDARGQLVAYYSTEEHRTGGFNQLLAHKVSTDGGLTWGPEVRDVAVPDRPDKKMRPGMAIVRRMPDQRYVMVYEICGMGCDVFVRFSDDGLNWGNPADPGTRIESTKGYHFAHAPSFTVLADGRLLVVGQLLMDAANQPVADTGKVLMMSQAGGTGPWIETPAPVTVPKAYDNPCPNYSSQLLPSSDGKRLLEIALRFDGDVCKAYSATLPMPVSK